MRTQLKSLVLLAVALCMGASLASGAPFDPVFRLMNLTGEASVKLPGTDSYVPAQDGKAYPYGTSVRTGAGTSALVVYSEGNSCKAGPNGMFTVDATAIFLEAGKLEIVLEDDKQLTVATPCSSGETLGGDFTVEVKPESELIISVYTCTSGALTIMSDMFTCPELGPGDLISASCALDQSFIRLKNIKGQYDVSFTDDTGSPRSVGLVEDSVVKIWRRNADQTDAVAVTILLVAPDGTLKEAINYVIQPPKGGTGDQPVMGDDDDDDDDQPPPVLGDDDDDDDDENVLEPEPSPGGDDDDDDDDGTYPIPDDITPKGRR